MGGGEKTQFLRQDPRISGQIFDELGRFRQQAEALQPQIQETAGKLRNITPTAVPSFAPTFQTGLDPTARAQVARGTEAVKAGSAATQRKISRGFQGSGVGRVLGAQASITGQLQQNPLRARAQEAQAGRQIGEQGLISRTKLAQFQVEEQGRQTARDEAVRSLAISGTGAQQSQNVLSVLGSLAGLTGERVSKQGK